MATKPRHEEAAANGPRSQPVRITENYSDYKPPFRVEPIIRRMLDSIPDKYLNGLSEVVLTNASGLSRVRRRSVTKSRKRKVRQASALGLYHPAWKGKQAWIEIFVDNTLKHWDQRSWWFRFGFNKEARIGDVLFHEIGHHIHFTCRPEFRETEDVADAWKVRLLRNHIRRRHWLLRALSLPIRPLIGMLQKPLYLKMLNNGMLSRAEFGERMKTLR